MDKPLKIVFMGTPEFAVASLDKIYQAGHTILAVVTSPDKLAGRGMQLKESEVKKYAHEKNFKILQPESLKEESFIETLKQLNADIFVVVAFRMLPEKVWQLPRLGTFNLHASLLPQYRGAAPINWAIINGETKTGVTTFLIDKEIDTGKVLLQREVTINQEDNAGTLHDKLMKTGSDLVVETITMLGSGEHNPIPQERILKDISSVKPAPKIYKEDCKIKWNKPGAQIHNFIRGLSPYPGAFTEVYTDSSMEVSAMVKIYSTEFIPKPDSIFNSTFITDSKTYLYASIAGGLISIKELQLAGKKRMPVNEFLKGAQNIAQLRIKMQ